MHLRDARRQRDHSEEIRPSAKPRHEGIHRIRSIRRPAGNINVEEGARNHLEREVAHVALKITRLSSLPCPQCLLHQVDHGVAVLAHPAQVKRRLAGVPLSAPHRSFAGEETISQEPADGRCPKPCRLDEIVVLRYENALDVGRVTQQNRRQV